MNKFLLVEDDKIVQTAQQYTLNQLGYKVDVAETSAAAMQMLLDNNNQYSLIFLDIGLPDADGIMLSEEMRTMFSYDAPIIAVTANMNDERWEICKKVGMDDFIVKPATRDKFVSIIHKWLPIALNN